MNVSRPGLRIVQEDAPQQNPSVVSKSYRFAISVVSGVGSQLKSVLKTPFGGAQRATSLHQPTPVTISTESDYEMTEDGKIEFSAQAEADRGNLGGALELSTQISDFKSRQWFQRGLMNEALDASGSVTQIDSIIYLLWGLEDKELQARCMQSVLVKLDSIQQEMNFKESTDEVTRNILLACSGELEQFQTNPQYQSELSNAMTGLSRAKITGILNSIIRDVGSFDKVVEIALQLTDENARDVVCLEMIDLGLNREECGLDYLKDVAGKASDPTKRDMGLASIAINEAKKGNFLIASTLVEQKIQSKQGKEKAFCRIGIEMGEKSMFDDALTIADEKLSNGDMEIILLNHIVHNAYDKRNFDVILKVAEKRKGGDRHPLDYKMQLIYGRAEQRALETYDVDKVLGFLGLSPESYSRSCTIREFVSSLSNQNTHLTHLQFRGIFQLLSDSDRLQNIDDHLKKLIVHPTMTLIRGEDSETAYRFVEDYSSLIPPKIKVYVTQRLAKGGEFDRALKIARTLPFGPVSSPAFSYVVRMMIARRGTEPRQKKSALDKALFITDREIWGKKIKDEIKALAAFKSAQDGELGRALKIVTEIKNPEIRAEFQKKFDSISPHDVELNKNFKNAPTRNAQLDVLADIAANPGKNPARAFWEASLMRS